MVKSKWRRMSLDQIGDFSKGSGINRAESHTGDIPAVRYGELYTAHNNYIRNFVSHISREVADGAKRVHCGDILFACSGETKEDIAKCAAVVDDIEAYAGGDIIILTPRIKVHPVFLGFMLNTPEVIKQRSSKAQGDAIVHISSETLKSIEISLPEYHEQTRIASALSNIDELTVKLEVLIAKKKAIKYGAMQELLTGKKRPPGFSGEWSKFNLMKHSKIKARIGWQGLKKSEYLDSGYALLVTGTDFADGKVQWDSCHYVTRDRYDQDRNIQIQNNDVLITKDGSLGKAALVQGLSKPATLNSGIFVIRPLQDAYDPVFVYHILSSFVFKDFLDKLSAGSTIIHLYQKDVGKFEFLLPPTIEEQKAIAAVLSEMDADIAALEEKLVKYRQVKQGMMQQLLTGKIRLV